MPQLIGENIDPRSFLQDYSGYANAANSRADAITGAVGKVSNAYTDYAKEQKEAKNALKAGQVQIEAAMKLFPDQADYLGQIANELKNEDTPLSARAEISKQTADYISMAVGQKRYETDQYYRDQELGMRRQDQVLQERESALRQQVTSLNVTAAENEANQAAVDQQTKEQMGTPLADSMLELLRKSDPAMAEKLAANREDNTPAEDYSLATSIMSLIPKAERRSAPTVTEVPVPGGTQKMQWDETSGQFVPIQTSVAPVQSGDPTNPNLPIFTPPDATDEELGGLLPPPGKSASAPIGFTPAVTPAQEQEAKISTEKHAAEKAAVIERKTAAVAKSQELIARLDALEKHDGFSDLFGTTWKPFAKNIPGTDAADANAIFKQIEGKGFIEAIQDMKGMGALSNAEGEKASAAFLGMNTDMTEAAAKARIKEIKELVAAGIARTSSGIFVNPDGSPKTGPQVTREGASSRLGQLNAGGQ